MSKTQTNNGVPDVALFACSVMLQQEEGGNITTSHTLHWCTVENHDAAIAYAITRAKEFKPNLDISDVICANVLSGVTKKIAFANGVATGEY